MFMRVVSSATGLLKRLYVVRINNEIEMMNNGTVIMARRRTWPTLPFKVIVSDGMMIIFYTSFIYIRSDL